MRAVAADVVKVSLFRHSKIAKEDNGDRVTDPFLLKSIKRF